MLCVLNPLDLGGTQLQVPEIPNDGCHQEVIAQPVVTTAACGFGHSGFQCLHWNS